MQLTKSQKYVDHHRSLVASGNYDNLRRAEIGIIKNCINRYFVVPPTSSGKLICKLQIPIVPHKAVAEVSKIGNL
jgi:hypothetical protein